MDVKTKKFHIMVALRNYLEGDKLVNFEKDIYKIIDSSSDILFVNIVKKHIDLEKLKNKKFPNDYLLYNLINYDYNGKSLKLGSSKLMKLYLQKEKLI